MISGNDKETLQGFVTDNTDENTVAYTVEAKAYSVLPRRHETENHKAKQFVNGDRSTNRVQALWSITKRGIHRTYHNISPMHTQRYINEFTGRHKIRPFDTIDQMSQSFKAWTASVSNTTI